MSMITEYAPKPNHPTREMMRAILGAFNIIIDKNIKNKLITAIIVALDISRFLHYFVCKKNILSNQQLHPKHLQPHFSLDHIQWLLLPPRKQLFICIRQQHHDACCDQKSCRVDRIKHGSSVELIKDFLLLLLR